MTGENRCVARLPTTGTRVLCVDDQAVCRDAMREVIAATPGFTQVGEAACGEAAIASATALRPDLVLMDVNHARAQRI